MTIRDYVYAILFGGRGINLGKEAFDKLYNIIVGWGIFIAVMLCVIAFLQWRILRKLNEKKKGEQ